MADDEMWKPIHATFILGTIGGDRALEGLLAAMENCCEPRHIDVFDAIHVIVGSWTRTPCAA
jgi:hypothetical protein